MPGTKYIYDIYTLTTSTHTFIHIVYVYLRPFFFSSVARKHVCIIYFFLYLQDPRAEKTPTRQARAGHHYPAPSEFVPPCRPRCCSESSTPEISTKSDRPMGTVEEGDGDGRGRRPRDAVAVVIHLASHPTISLQPQPQPHVRGALDVGRGGRALGSSGFLSATFFFQNQTVELTT